MATDELGPQVEVVAAVFLTVSWVAVSMRCYVRIFITGLFRIDDWLTVLTMVAFTFYCSFVITGAPNSIAQHEEHEDFMKWWYCGEITYGITTCLMKVSFGAFLLQICVHRAQRIIIWTVIITMSIFSAYYVPLMIGQCHPVSYFWTRHGDGKCLELIIIERSTYAHGALSAVADWTLGTIPIFLVWSLQMSTKTKVSASLLLALGSIGSTATIVRMPYIRYLLQTSNFLYFNTNLSIWSTIEAGVGITASSLACVRPLFQMFFLHSRLILSRNHGTPFRSSSQITGVPDHQSVSQDNRLSRNLSWNILVTTVIKSHSAPRGRDVEMLDNYWKGSNERSIGLTGMDAWETRKPRMLDDSSDDIC